MVKPDAVDRSTNDDMIFAGEGKGGDNFIPGDGIEGGMRSSGYDSGGSGGEAFGFE